MITLCARIQIQSHDATEKGIDPTKWYDVIGTLHRQFITQDKNQPQDLLIVINDEGKAVNLFISKLKIRRTNPTQ